jgi:hypothetical protein
VPTVLRLCAVFDRPGLPCGLEGRVDLLATPPTAEAGPEALGAYLSQCAELACRLRSGGTPSGVKLDLKVGGSAAGAGGEDAGGLLDRVLGAMLPAAAPHVASLRLLLPFCGSFPPGFSRHLTAGLAFPLLTTLELNSQHAGHDVRLMGQDQDQEGSGEILIDAADVAALAFLVAPQLRRVGLLCPAFDTGVEYPGGIYLGAGSTAAVTALAMGLARPVDAAGRPAGLRLVVGDFVSEEYDESGLKRAQEGAGRAWVRVVWPPYYDSDSDSEDDASSD